jgi:DNA-binding response OmpR family regulator
MKTHNYMQSIVRAPEPDARERVLIVDDEAEVRGVLREGLLAAGYDVAEADDRATLLERLGTEPVALITLDLGLGGEADGLELAREVRATHNVPIVMITGRSKPFDRVVGLENGADDYIVKPFHIREVVMRIGHVLRRYRLELREQLPAVDIAPLYAIDHSVLDTVRRELRHNDGTPIELTETEYRLLELFVTHPERVLSRDEINRALRGQEWSPFDRTIDGHIARLRRKLEPLAETPQMIKSVRGVGYVFTSIVKTL